MIKVLIVEDNPMVALVNKEYLEKIGDIEIYGPVVTEEEVLEILDIQSIQLILMDEYLPKENGMDIIKTIRNKGYVTDIIMITAANSKEEVREAFAYGVVDYLVKPFTFDRFKEAIDQYIMRQAYFRRKTTITQRDIDDAYLNKNEEILELPKGLNKRTLGKIIYCFERYDKDEWKIRELAEEIKVSNVTIKKYMDYLEGINKVSVDLSSGNIGRPEYRYRLKY